jgi:hypothetical protein
MNSEKKVIRLFLDMDGVFCDFEKGVQDITGGKGSDELDDEELWPVIMKNPRFFAQLDPMAGAMELWKGVRDFLKRSEQKIPIFLTGCPSNKQFRQWAEEGKEAWVRKYCLEEGGDIFPLSVPAEATFEKDAAEVQEKLERLLEKAGDKDIIMIFCRPKQKFFFSRKAGMTAVLLDDRVGAGKLWTEPGYFLWHESTPTNFKNKKHRNNTSRKAVEKSVAKLATMKGGRGRSRKSK